VGRVLLLDKPEGPTSHDMVDLARKALSLRRVGHTGTLDPMATGLLVLLLGKATRLAELFRGHTKRYRGAIRFGRSTDTDDRTGQTLEEAAGFSLDEETLRRGLAELAARADDARGRERHVSRTDIAPGGEQVIDIARIDRPQRHGERHGRRVENRLVAAIGRGRMVIERVPADGHGVGPRAPGLDVRLAQDDVADDAPGFTPPQ